MHAGTLPPRTMAFEIDQIARENALQRWGLPECLHVPTGAIDEIAISTYIGEIVQVVSKRTANKALLVKCKEPAPPDIRLPIWDDPASEILHRSMQLWVHVNYTGYRSAYRRAFPEEDTTGKIISHSMNRRFGRVTGFEYVRITSTSRSANSSSGMREKWGVSLYDPAVQSKEQMRKNASIRYGDLADLMLMMSIKLGGGIMEVVNEGQKLVEPSGSMTNRVKTPAPS